ncbi:phospholipase A2 inhibitor gamma subunit B-like [Carettochelys insculpta]|uniref:phospholipase A2 inhibitor gamma subunit B-like n=1 Tax=Carettochelys insculpta TaxID=44489 RepID=UPI003EB69603
MKASLAIFILAALLATGACLQCQVCSNTGTSCTGDVQTCAAGNAFCASTLTEVRTLGTTTPITLKKCATSADCQASPISINFGNGNSARSIIACCTGDGCSPAPITMPAPDTKPNGQRCPVCSAVSPGPCNEMFINCTGSDTQCIEMTVTVTSGGATVSSTLKGCANEVACAQGEAVASSFAGVGGTATLKCKAPGTAPGLAGLLGPALAGLLLLKFSF